MKNLKSLIIIFTLILISCQSSSSFDKNETLKQIEAQNSKWMKYYNAQDAESVAELFSENSIVMPPNFRSYKGKKEVLKSINEEFRAGVTDLALKTTDISGSGDLVVEFGEYSLNIKDGDELKGSDQGKYIVIWEKAIDGSFKVKADIWNSNLPGNY